MEKESITEKISGSLPTKIGTTLLATFTGNPLAALLPILTESLASNRHKIRIENAINEIEKILSSHNEKIKNLTGSQYKIVNEAVLSVFHTIEEQKIDYLKKVIFNTIDETNISPHEAEVLSRTIRDISADEAKFLIEYCNHRAICLDSQRAGYTPINGNMNLCTHGKTLYVEPKSKEGFVVSSLIGLGLLVPINDGALDKNYIISQVVIKLLQLLK